MSEPSPASYKEAKDLVVYALVVGALELLALYFIEGLALFFWCIAPIGVAVIVLLWIRKPNERTRENFLFGLAYAYVTAVGLGYLAHTEEVRVVVDVDGSPSGLAPTLRAMIKPKTFYSGQKFLIEKEWNDLQASHESGWSKVQAIRQQGKKAFDQAISDPETQKLLSRLESGLSQSEKAARELERQAEAIREQDADVRLAQYFDQQYQAKLQALKQQYQAVERKLNGSGN